MNVYVSCRFQKCHSFKLKLKDCIDLSKDELERIAAINNVELTYDFEVKKEGWMGKDENTLNLYSLKGKKNQLDENGKLKQEFERYSLRTLMSRYSAVLQVWLMKNKIK